MINIVLCGGSGTRLWPISRKLMPKQFVKLFEEKSLFQLTVERNSKICDSQLIVSNSEQYFLALDQLEEIEKENNRYLLEPIGKNTAPAIALACFSLDYDDIVLVTPSDHLIKNREEYNNCLNQAKVLAEEDFLVTFGIKPTTPEIGYGYIEANAQDVRAFHEKPDLKTAEKYVKNGNYYWNSGMFCFKVGLFLEELKEFSPEIYNYSKIAYEKANQSSVIRIELEDMKSIPEDSIDYAVMEKSQKVKVIPSNIDWSDVGCFDVLYDELPKDENLNTLNSNYIGIDSSSNLVIGNERKIATVDIENLMIIDTPDALLISKRGSSQKVKEVVSQLKSENSELHNFHLTTHRPWGVYTILEDSIGYKIKRIEVKPGKRLSLQKHMHRNEHWIVLSGTATVTVGDAKRYVRPNESTYIKMGEVHRLENEGKIPVVLIEAQVGEYTGEDDIVRINDDFNRNS
jgi:mannose-1-phosphate guanylyltransferase